MLAFGRLRQLRDQTERNGKLIELEVRPQEGHGAVHAGAARHLGHLHAGFAQRELRLLVLARVIVEQDVLGQPAVQVILDVGGGGEAADLVAHHGLHVVRDARHGEDVLQLRRQHGIGIGRLVVVLARLLGRLGAEEGRIRGVLAMHQRDEAEIGQLLLAAVGDRDLGRAFQRHFSLVGLEGVGRQVLDQAAALDAADRGAPAIVLEGARQARAEGIGRVAPQVLVVLDCCTLIAPSLSWINTRIDAFVIVG